jgi:hypothetical protein
MAHQVIRNEVKTSDVVRVEATLRPRTGVLDLTFVDLTNETVTLKGKVVFSRGTSAGTHKIGVKLLGKATEIEDFVKKLVRYHHYTKNIKCVD